MANIYQDPQLIANADSPLYDQAYPDGDRGAPAGDWQVASGYFIGAKFSPVIISPQPDDADTGYYWRWCTANDDYKVRVVVQGGAPPFKFELLQAPSGATIVDEFDRSTVGSFTVHSYPTDYGVITWANPTSGTHTFQVRVTDQSGNVDTVTWTATLDETKFVWVNASTGSDSNDGSFASPLQTFNVGLWNSSDANTEFAGRIAKFYTGTYTVNDGTTDSNATLNRSNKPIAYMKVDGESPVFDMHTGHFANSGVGACDGITFYGITFDGGRDDVSDARLISVGNADDVLFWGNTIRNTGAASASGSDNPCVLWLSDLGASQRSRISIVDNVIASTADLQLFVAFTNDYIVEENSSYTNVPGLSCSNMKDGNRYATRRFCSVTGNASTTAFFWQNQGSPNQFQEDCYNIVYATYTGGSPNATALSVWNQQTGSESDMHSYRNTIAAINGASGSYAIRFYDADENVNTQGNLYVSSQSNPILGTAYTDGTPTSEEVASTDFDISGHLTEAALSSYAGKGATIAEPI